MRLEDLSPGATVRGVAAGGAVTVVAATNAGTDAVVLTYRDANRRLDERVLYRADEPNLTAVTTATQRPFDAPGADFRLAAEAQRIKLAGLFDPMLALASSDVDPLPHQIRAVYGELLPRTPLRFLLADDPGAGKTIMAGLYIKELLLRGDLARCLIVVPGGLVEQWQDELHGRFDLEFEILSTAMIEATVSGSVLDRHPLLIARMDQLARSEELLDALRSSEWDLVVVDEAHRMAAHYFGNELTTTKRYELGRLLGQISRHLLLMTATPHAGKEEDFQLFLALLDPDRFEGKFRRGAHSTDTTGLMRRMIKEELLTFEGKPLFPERIAETAPYKLSPLESDLYADVTHYVRTEMNRADRLESPTREHRGLRPHRSPASARLQPGGHLAFATTTQASAGDARRADIAGAGRIAATGGQSPGRPRRSRRVGRRSGRATRGGSGRRGHSRPDGAGAGRRAADADRPGTQGRPCPPIGPGPQMERAADHRAGPRTGGRP